MFRKIALIMVVMSLLSPGFYLGAKTLKGVTFEDSVSINGTQTALNGMAVRTKFIFKVYVAGLYVQQKDSNPNNILKKDEIRRGVMHFLRDVEKGKISEAWQDALKANTPNYSPELKKQFDTLCSWMEDIKDGERIVMTYIPGTGTSIETRGKQKGILPGKEFADALFSCWIGPKPGPGEGFKKGLLGLE